MYQGKSPELFLRQKGNQQKRSNNAQMFIIQTLSSQLVGGALLLSKNSAYWDQNIDSCQKMYVSWDLVLNYNGPKKLSLDIHFHQQKYTCLEKVLFRMRKIRQLSFYCTVSAFNCAARSTMMLRDQNTSNYSFSLSSSLSIEKWLIISLLFTSTACNPPLSGSKGACWDFTEGACDLSETNIIDHDRFVDSPEECQVTAMI